MKQEFIPTPCQESSRRHAFTLVEMIGVLAIIAILAAVLLPAMIKQMDKIVADQETATLQAFGTAIQTKVLRSRRIPDATASGNNWIGAITNELGVPPNLVSTNTRNRARAFVIDTDGFSPIGLPYDQTSDGVSAPPSRARFMILSSLGSMNLPVSSGPLSKNDFSAIWDTPPNNVPSTWSATWNNGRGDDLIVQRINLSPLFVNLILTTNNSTANYAYYSINLGDTNTVGVGGINAFFIQGSVLNLFSNVVVNPLPDSQQVLQRDTSFVYDQNVWRTCITSISLANTNIPDFSGIVNGFVNAGIRTNSNDNTINRQVAQDFIDYMAAYINWATNSIPFSTSKQPVVDAWTTMMIDVNNLVNKVTP